MEITIVEMQSENHPYGDPDQGVPEEALRDFIATHPIAEEDSVCKGEHEFIIWRGEDTSGKYGTFFANAWTIPEVGAEREYTTYYEFKTTEDAFHDLAPTTVDIPLGCDTPILQELQDRIDNASKDAQC
jgi:hypothetical protein